MGEEAKKHPPRDRFSIEEELLRRVGTARISLQQAMEKFDRLRAESADGVAPTVLLMQAEHAYNVRPTDIISLFRSTTIEVD